MQCTSEMENMDDEDEYGKAISDLLFFRAMIQLTQLFSLTDRLFIGWKDVLNVYGQC